MCSYVKAVDHHMCEMLPFSNTSTAQIIRIVCVSDTQSWRPILCCAMLTFYANVHDVKSCVPHSIHLQHSKLTKYMCITITHSHRSVSSCESRNVCGTHYPNIFEELERKKNTLRTRQNFNHFICCWWNSKTFILNVGWCFHWPVQLRSFFLKFLLAHRTKQYCFVQSDFIYDSKKNLNFVFVTSIKSHKWLILDSV